MSLDHLPLNRAGALQPVVRTLQGLGQPVEPLLRRARVSAAWLEASPEALMPLECLYRVLERASREVGPSFGAVAADVPVTATGAFGRAIRQSITVYDALRTFVRLGPAFGPLHRVWLREDPKRDAVWVCRNGPLPFEGGVAQSELMVLRHLIQIVRLAAGKRWTPLELRLRSGASILAALRDVEAFQGVTERFGWGWGGICIPRSVVHLPMPRSDEGARDPSEAWPTLPTSEGFALPLREILLSLLTLKSDVTIQTVAEMAGIHPRTLQRRLAEEGSDFRTVLSKARHLRARQLLTETDLCLTEIAFELKYSDLAHFSRAYRRWAGAPPSEHRRAPEVLGHAVP